MPMPKASDVLVIWVIYDRPRDHPGHFVVRRQFVMPPGPVIVGADGRAIPPELAPHGTVPSGIPGVEMDRWRWLAPTLNAARAHVPPGLVWRDRHPGDDPCIAEVWL